MRQSRTKIVNLIDDGQIEKWEKLGFVVDGFDTENTVFGLKSVFKGYVLGEYTEPTPTKEPANSQK
ncbi:hypothetical protein ACXZ1K_18370 [Pedobacter sp. PWIIR3]